MKHLSSLYAKQTSRINATGLAFIFIVLIGVNGWGAVFTSAATGNWNTVASWTYTGTDADGIPDADDEVTILSSHTITVTTATTNCLNIAVEGTLSSNGTSTRNLVTGSVNGNGTINGQDATINFSINFTGNWNFTGTVNSTNRVSITVSASTVEQTLNGSASFWNITVNKPSGTTLFITGSPSRRNTFAANSSTINYSASGPQTVLLTPFSATSTLILSGSGLKTFTGVTVRGTLSMEGSATATAPTYAATAKLQYKGSVLQTTGPEFPATFAGTGGVAIDNPNGVNLSGTHTVNNGFTITSAGLFTIPFGQALRVNGTFINSGTAANLVIESDGQLNESTTGIPATVKRNITNSTWHLISVPNNSTTAGTFSGDYLESWNEPTATWSYITNPSTLLTPLDGYGLWSVSGTTQSVYTGTLNTGDYSKSVTRTILPSTANDGANLLGNPYPCSIDWNGLRVAWGAVYYWNGTTYVSWNNGGVGSRYIPPMQGFFIIAPNAGTFTIANTNKTFNTTTYYKSSLELNSNTIVLATMGESYSDKLFITFNPEATEGFDLIHDAYKLLAYTPGVSEIYSYSGETMLSIDVRPEAQVIPLGFRNDQTGTYQIGIDEFVDIPVAFLEDLKTNTFHDLFTGPYTFDYTAGENAQRFLLHFGTTDTPENETPYFNIYSYQKTIYIDLKDRIKGDIFIYNTAGQLLKTASSSSGMNEINMPNTGIYLVKVISDGSSMVKKIWIQ